MSAYSPSPIALRELRDTPADRATLAAFYTNVYQGAFPDVDEREPLAHIADYLRRKSQGWYGLNAYHVVIAERYGAMVGGYIADYLEGPNAGVIEFLFTIAQARGTGVGRCLLDHAEQLLQADAVNAGHTGLQWIAAEMNDPYVIPSVADNLDPFVRARIWDGWGFGALDFPYVQPALSAARRPVKGLLLIAKLSEPLWRDGVPAVLVKLLVSEYMRWAMRIEAPSRNAQYRAMRAWLAARETVEWQRLKRMIGEDAPRAFEVLELRDPLRPEFGAAIDVYRRALATSATAIEPQAFVDAIEHAARTGCRYHLWAIRDRGSRTIAGMSSFFSFERMGFGGYIVLEAPLRGVGCLRPLLARIEQQMRADNCGIRGWLIECETEPTAAIFARRGFTVLVVDYRQPELPGASVAARPALRLMYKLLGRVYAAPALSASELLAGLGEVLRHVYGVEQPQKHATYRRVAAQVEQGVPLG